MLLETIIFLGTYTMAPEGAAAGEGIYVCRMAQDGSLQVASIAKGIENPSFLVLNKAGTHLYAVSETENFEDKAAGSVVAFAFDAKSLTLKAINEQSTQGAHPCHIVLDRSERWLLVANYTGGSTAVLPIQKDGSIGKLQQLIRHEGSSINKFRQRKAHAHATALDQASKFAYVPDLGSDKVWQFKFDKSKGLLEPNSPAYIAVEPGQGPRHLAIHPNGRWAYGNNELLGTIYTYDLNKDKGTLIQKQSVSTLPEDFKESNSTAEILVSPDGRFVYCSNRGHDSIAIFKVHPENGTLTFVDRPASGGKTPRNFNLHPTGKFMLVAHQDSGNVVTFAVDGESGKLTRKSELALPRCVCVKFLEIKP